MTRRETLLIAGYTATAWVGLATDGALLTLMEHMGTPAAWARVLSLAAAMQATFWINGLWVFRRLTKKNWAHCWLGYMASSSIGNFCNYWTFVTLVSLHSPLWSNRWVDLVIGGVVAWTVNYGFARLLVFGSRRDGAGEPGTPLARLIEKLTSKPAESRTLAAGVANPVQSWRGAE